MKIQAKLLITFLFISITPIVFIGILNFVDSSRIISDHVIAMQHMTGMEDLQNSLVAQLDQLKVVLTIAATVTAFLVILAAVLIARSIARPIQKLTKVADNISKGQFDTSIDPDILSKKGEIGDLARAFDRTVASLKLAMMERDQKETQD